MVYDYQGLRRAERCLRKEGTININLTKGRLVRATFPARGPCSLDVVMNIVTDDTGRLIVEESLEIYENRFILALQNETDFLRY